MEITRELFEIAKVLAKKSQQTSHVFILKIWSATDLNATISLFFKVSCGRILFCDFFKDTNT